MFTKPDENCVSADDDSDECSISVGSQALSDVPSEIIIKTRIKYGSRWTAFKAVLAEYSKSTSVHGIRYIFEVHRPFYEKLYWLFFMSISLYFAISLMWATYLKWLDSPVIIGFDETLVPIHRIPFPTITICPEIKMDTLVFDFHNISQQLANNARLTEEDLARFQASLQLCENEVINRFAWNISKNLDMDVSQNLRDVALDANTTMPFCKWNNRFYFCHVLVKYVLTNEGVCYQFNGLEAKDLYRHAHYGQYTADQPPIDFNEYFDKELPQLNNISGTWSLDNGYQDQGFNSYPQRSIISSARNGFFALLTGFEHNFDYTCRSFKQGYKVFLNSPESIPLTTSGNYILVPHDNEVLVSIIPQYVISTKNLHDFEPHKRQCFFTDERYLRFFKTYSQSNCQAECLTNFTITKCGCVKFWMPKPADVPLCGLGKVQCYNEAEEELNVIIQNQTEHKAADAAAKIMCNCMPACNSLDYNYEISAAFYDYEATVKAYREELDYDNAHSSRLSVYFKESQFTAIKRTVMFGVSTLIANCGGIFGLFMGISSLSFIEFLFFFSLRLFHNLRQRHLVKKKIIQEEQNVTESRFM